MAVASDTVKSTEVETSQYKIKTVKLHGDHIAIWITQHHEGDRFIYNGYMGHASIADGVRSLLKEHM